MAGCFIHFTQLTVKLLLRHFTVQTQLINSSVSRRNLSSRNLLFSLKTSLLLLRHLKHFPMTVFIFLMLVLSFLLLLSIIHMHNNIVENYLTFYAQHNIFSFSRLFTSSYKIKINLWLYGDVTVELRRRVSDTTSARESIKLFSFHIQRPVGWSLRNRSIDTPFHVSCFHDEQFQFFCFLIF